MDAPYPAERSLVQADGLALALRGALERICLPLARAAIAFVRCRAWQSFGFARLDDHARERFGRSGRWVRDLAALGEAFDRLPGLAPALTGDDGGPPLGRVAALLIGRVATPDSLAGWIAHSRSVTVRGLRAAVREARASGSRLPPGDPPDPPDASAAVIDAPLPITSPGEDDWPDRSLVRIPVPAPILATFDEAVDLYRAVEGTRAGVTSFIEALVAEASAGGAGLSGPPASRPLPSLRFTGDPDRISLRTGMQDALVESALARSTDNWSHLPGQSPASWAFALAGASLTRLESLLRAAGDGKDAGDPADLDARIRSLIHLENELEARLGRLLAEMAERGAWPRLRFAGSGHYAEQRLGLSRTSAEDRARVARALRRFPLLRAAYEDGRLGLEATLLVLRVLGHGPVDRDTEAAWVARAEEATVKRLRDEARALGRHRFEAPASTPAPALASALASALAPAPASAPASALAPAPAPTPTTAPAPAPARAPAPGPGPLDDATWHASLRREPGTARRRIIYYGHLAASWRPAPGALPAPDVFLRLRLPDQVAIDLLEAIEAARAHLSARVDAVPWDEPWPDPDPSPSVAAARTFSTRSRRVPAWVGLLALLEDFACTWDAGGSRDPVAAGAPPRRPGDAVYIRDGWRCTAPACTSARNLEDHHIVYRSQQGNDDLCNRTCLCRFHHQRGEHGRLASCIGTAPLGITWRLGLPELATWYRNERRMEIADGSPAGGVT